jgi:hypothetical protein
MRVHKTLRPCKVNFFRCFIAGDIFYIFRAESHQVASYPAALK